MVYDQSQYSTSLMAKSSIGSLYEPRFFQWTISKDDSSYELYFKWFTIIKKIITLKELYMLWLSRERCENLAHALKSSVESYSWNIKNNLSYFLMGKFCLMIDKNKNGVRAYHSQTEVKNCSLSPHKVVDTGNNFFRQFIDDNGLDTVGFV